MSFFSYLKAWHLCDPDAERVFEALRTSGVKLAVVSNFDTRLRPLLRALNCDHWFDAVAVSAEVSINLVCLFLHCYREILPLLVEIQPLPPSLK